MKVFRTIIGLAFLILLSFSNYICVNAAQLPYTLYPIPVSELTEIVIPWFEQDGFSVTKIQDRMGQVQLKGLKEGHESHFLLKPHSALASEMWFIQSSNAVQTKYDLSKFEAYLNNYIYSISDNQDSLKEQIPPIIQSLSPAVVCVKAIHNEDEVQISGFFLDNQGIILSTAHGLTKNHDITVILGDGLEMKGQLLKTDKYKDLSLIKINYQPPVSISLENGRNVIENGERLFTIGCPDNRLGSIHTGFIDSKPRKIGDQPLWQINMEILLGHSGSPVFDTIGNIVAIVKGRYRGDKSIGFLIPYQTLIGFLTES